MENTSNSGFEYVLDKNIRPKVCFGSGIVREVLPRSGPAMTPFMKAMGAARGTNLDVYENPPIFCDPNKKPSSCSGTLGKSVRWPVDKSYQPPRRSSAIVISEKMNFTPFNQTGIQRRDIVLNSNPGPGTYRPSDRKRQMKFFHSFGGKKTIIPAVDIKCVPYNEDVCSQCGSGCGQRGDYWHKDNKLFMCRECIQQSYKQPSHKKTHYAGFKPIRDCSFAHHHELFQNSIKLMTFRQIRKIVNKEAYFNMYFSHVTENKYT